VAAAREQFAHPAQQRGRVTADPDVPVGQQDGHPAARAGYAPEHVAQDRERARRLRDLDRIRRDVDAQRRDTALGERHGEPPRSRAHVERGPVAAVDE